MYLALLPDAESLAALKRFAPSVSDDAHLTIIHSKANPEAWANGVAPLAVPKWSRGMTLKTNGVAIFGWKRKVLVLRLNVLNDELVALRSQAETILRDAGLPWSAEWPFSPHITLDGPPIYGRVVGEAPTTLRFDRMEWR